MFTFSFRVDVFSTFGRFDRDFLILTLARSISRVNALTTSCSTYFLILLMPVLKSLSSLILAPTLYCRNFWPSSFVHACVFSVTLWLPPRRRLCLLLAALVVTTCLGFPSVWCFGSRCCCGGRFRFRLFCLSFALAKKVFF